MNVFDALADKIREVAQSEAPPPVERWKVARSNPLVIEDMTGEVVLEEGDPDVEFDAMLLALRPDRGDLVRVHSDGDGDWIVSGAVERDGDDVLGQLGRALVPVVQSLPGSAPDGAEVLYRGPGAPACGWRLRFDASARANRWQAVTRQVPQVLPESESPRVVPVSAVYAAPVSGGPRYSTPFAGVWRIALVGIASVAAAGESRAAAFVAGALLAGSEAVATIHTTGVAQTVNVWRWSAALPANTVVEVRYRSNVGGNWFQLAMEMEPVEVGG